VGIDWAWELVFPRDLSHFRPVQSDPISKAHFAPGEVLFRHNEPLKELYAIESGEAEIAQRNDFNGEYRTLQTLPAGSVIGEATLSEYMSENMVVRARTPLDVYVLGKDSLTRLSKALAPVEEIIERAVKRPRVSIWRHHPTAMQALATRCVAELPTSYPLLAAEARSTLGSVYHQLIENKHGCVVITEAGRIVGIATRSDLLAALARGATRETPIREAMNAKFICMMQSDSAAKAAERMADDGLKFLPVVDDSGKPTAVLTSDDFVRFALAMPR
jgi:NADH dehydrogenase